MTVGTVAIAVAIFAIPTAFFSALFLWSNAQQSYAQQVDSLARLLSTNSSFVFSPKVWLNTWVSEKTHANDFVELRSQYSLVNVGAPVAQPRFEVSRTLSDGSTLIAQHSATDTVWQVLGAWLLVVVGALFLILISYVIAKRAALRLSAPLVLLAAQAQQIGTGQVRGKVAASGIEEIDLVQEELSRTSERMAERIAAERQFSRDVSHQIRTPLTALTLRLEEIEYLNDDPEVATQVEACIGQAERLSQIIDTLLTQISTRKSGNTQALPILEIFAPLREEWEPAFERAGRDLVFQDDTTRWVMATPAALSQVLATLLENSLKYGAGTTRVLAQDATGGKNGFLLHVSDEGEGISDEIAPHIFEKGFSGKGSSGIGLGIAKDLVQSDGGNLTLVSKRPPMFVVTLQAEPDATKNRPQGALIVSGRRRSRLS